MKYVLVDGDYREFRGKIFLRDVPREISDQGTLDAIAHNPSFRRIEDEKEQRQGQGRQEVLNEMREPVTGPIGRQVLSLKKRMKQRADIL